MNRDLGTSSFAMGGASAQPRPQIPGHQMLLRIGSGAYGEVWLARTVTDTYRAVKVVYRNSFSEERPYLREFEGVRQFESISREHPGLVDVLQVDRPEGTGFFYYVMELADDAHSQDEVRTAVLPPGSIMEGRSAGARTRLPRRSFRHLEEYKPKTLKTILRPIDGSSNALDGTQPRIGLPAPQCLEIACKLADALSYLHRSGLVHRDIKPSNIVFVDGSPKLADIGLVAAASKDLSIVGTEGYIAPEGPGGPPADIFALGKVLYEMVTGLGVKDYPRLPEGWGHGPGDDVLNELNQIALRASEGKQQWRYQTAEEMRLDLDLLRSGKSLLLRKWQRKVRRMQRVLAVVAGCVLVVMFAFGVWFFRNRAAEENWHGQLKELEISRMRLRMAGWFTNSWLSLHEAAAFRKDSNVLGHTTALLAGLDAWPVRILRGFSGVSAAFASDGRVLVSGLGTDPLMLLDTQGARTELPVRGAGPVCWTPADVPLQLIATTNALLLREALTGTVQRQFPFAGANPSNPDYDPALTMTPDGTVIAAVLHQQLVLWSATTGEQCGALEVEASAIAFSPDGALLGVGSQDGTTRVYTVNHLALAAVLPPPARGVPILCLAFTRDHLVRYGAEKPGNSWLLATGDQGAGIVIWDLDRRMPRSFCRGSTWKVSALAFSPDGLTLASAGRNQPCLWDVATGKPRLLLSDASSGDTLALAFDPTGRKIICGGDPGIDWATLALWQLEPDRGIQALSGLSTPVRKIWLSPSGQRVAALSDDWHLAVWDIASHRLLFIFETPVGSLADSAGGAFDAKGEQFAVATGHEACLYNLATGGLQSRWQLNDGLSDQMQFDPQGRLLLLRREPAVAQDPKLWLWRLFALGRTQTPVLLHEQSDRSWSTEELALAPDGSAFLIWNGGPTGMLRVIRGYDAFSGRQLWQHATERTQGNSRFNFSPTGQFFAYNAYATSGRFRIMRLSDFQEIGIAESCHALSPSGHEVAAGDWFCSDGTSLQNAIPLATDWGPVGDACAFSQDGQLLAWGSPEGAVLVANLHALSQRLTPFRK